MVSLSYKCVDHLWVRPAFEQLAVGPRDKINDRWVGQYFALGREVKCCHEITPVFRDQLPKLDVKTSDTLRRSFRIVAQLLDFHRQLFIFVHLAVSPVEKGYLEIGQFEGVVISYPETSSSDASVVDAFIIQTLQHLKPLKV